jgi:predicted aspartyl protease
MINTYRHIVKDKSAVIPPQVVLTQKGAFVDVTISHPKIVMEKLREKNAKIQSYSTKALIDTGASRSVVSPKVVEELKLLQTGVEKVASVNDEQIRPVYFGLLYFPWGSSKEVSLLCCDIKGFHCLIGRDILQHWCFTYNGVDGSIIICD